MQGKRIIILIIVFFALAFQSVSAQEVSVSGVPTPTPISYALPYPGILPGNPLYFFKTIRDVIAGFLITGPLKKAEFDLLQTDKYLAISQALFDQKKEKTEIFSSLDQALAYFDNAIKKTEEAKKQGMESQALTQKLFIANLKHQEVVRSMVLATKGDDQKAYASRLEKLKEFGKKVKTLHRS